jgi:uncharacterized protein (DUF2249 family)
MISAETTVARLLEKHPELLEVLAGYHPRFEKLRNRLLRKVMAPRVTVAQAARIAGVSPDELLMTLRQAAGEASATEDVGADAERPAAAAAPSAQEPAALAAIPESRQHHIDVREDIRRGQEPFARIMAAVKSLGADHALIVRTPFEPIPLYDVLGKRGFAHWAESRAEDDWSVWFYRESADIPGVAAAGTRGEATARSERTVTIDVRGLEPPHPMVRVLERLESLGPGQVLEVIHERRPLFLYPQLDDRGFSHETDEPQPGVIRILIRRKDA